MAKLFDEGKSKEMTLQITAKNQQALSKMQLDFNKIIARTQKLEKDLIKKELELDNLLQFYHENLFPHIAETQDLQIKLCFILDKTFKKHSFPKKIKEQATEIILFLFGEAFTDREPNKEQEELFNAWSNITYQEELAESKAFEKTMFSSFFNFNFDVDLDLEDFDMDDPESIQKMKAALDEKMKATQQAEGEPKTKKKTKKQLEKEEMLKAEEELKTKNIRSIYISLTKVLHPDIESDDVLKKEKEEIMKQVTRAYEEKDLSTLLKLEMEWIHKTTEYLTELSEQKLKTYILVMRERARELEGEKYHLTNHPKYMSVQSYRNMSEKSAIKEIKNEVDVVKSLNNSLRENISKIPDITGKKEITSLIHTIYKDLPLEDESIFDFF